MAVASQHKLKPQTNEAGFTLVEILCVLAVLGLTAGLVVLNLPRGEDPFQAEVQSFATRMNIAARDSAVDGRIRGVEISETGYELFEYSGDWKALGSEDWKDVFNVTLSIEDQTIDFGERSKVLATAEDDVVPAPLLFLDPMGGVTSFELRLEGQEVSYKFSPDRRGRIIAEPVQ